MSAQKGPALVVKQGDGGDPETFDALAGVRAKTINNGLERIDVTTDEDVTLSGATQRTYISGLLDFSIDVSGIAKDVAASKQLVGDGRDGTVRNYQIEWPTIGTWEGAFFLADFAVTADYEGVIEFSATLTPQNVVTWTPVP